MKAAEAFAKLLVEGAEGQSPDYSIMEQYKGDYECPSFLMGIEGGRGSTLG